MAEASPITTNTSQMSSLGSCSTKFALMIRRILLRCSIFPTTSCSVRKRSRLEGFLLSAYGVPRKNSSTVGVHF